jgi:hypothetical protein
VLKICTREVTPDGSTSPLTDARKEELMGVRHVLLMPSCWQRRRCTRPGGVPGSPIAAWADSFAPPLAAVAVQVVIGMASMGLRCIALTHRPIAVAVQVVIGMASMGLRCIALTHRDMSLSELDARPKEFWGEAKNVDMDLTLDAIVGIKDPVRKEVGGWEGGRAVGTGTPLRREVGGEALSAGSRGGHQGERGLGAVVVPEAGCRLAGGVDY